MQILKKAAAAAAPLLLFVLPAGCADNEPDTAVEAYEEGGEERVELVTGEPFEATGVVTAVPGSDGFLLFDTLVIATTPAEVGVDDRVRVTGEVEPADEVRSRLGANLSEGVLDELDDHELVVVATAVEVVGQDSVE